MHPIVLYTSQYGHTQQYAQWIADALQCPLENIEKGNFPALNGYDPIIFGSPVYIGKIKGLTHLTKHADMLSGKRILLFTSAATPVEDAEGYREMLATQYPAALMAHTQAFHLPGGIDPARLRLPHRLILRMVRSMVSSRKAPEDMRFPLGDSNGGFNLVQRDAIQPLLSAALLEK